MMNAILLVLMLFFHVVDDYYLQGILSKMKCRSWWEENAPDDMYKNDYVVALLEHGFSWASMVHIPVVAYWFCMGVSPHWMWFVSSFIVMWLIHSFVDDLKANRKQINLLTDQAIHIVQVIILWVRYIAI